MVLQILRMLRTVNSHQVIALHNITIFNHECFRIECIPPAHTGTSLVDRPANFSGYKLHLFRLTALQWEYWLASQYRYAGMGDVP